MLRPKIIKREVLFDQIATDALDYSKANKCPDAYQIDKWHYAIILAWFKGRVAHFDCDQPVEWRLLKGRTYHHDEELQLTTSENSKTAQAPDTDASSRKTERSNGLHCERIAECKERRGRR